MCIPGHTGDNCETSSIFLLDVLYNFYGYLQILANVRLNPARMAERALTKLALSRAFACADTLETYARRVRINFFRGENIFLLRGIFHRY